MPHPGIGRPTAFLYLTEDVARIATDAASRAGFEPSPEIAGASIALVEIGRPRYLKVLDHLLDNGVRTIVIGEDPDDFVTVGLRAAGVWRVVRREAFVEDPASVFPLLA